MTEIKRRQTRSDRSHRYGRAKNPWEGYWRSCASVTRTFPMLCSSVPNRGLGSIKPDEVRQGLLSGAGAVGWGLDSVPICARVAGSGSGCMLAGRWCTRNPPPPTNILNPTHTVSQHKRNQHSYEATSPAYTWHPPNGTAAAQSGGHDRRVHR